MNTLTAAQDKAMSGKRSIQVEKTYGRAAPVFAGGAWQQVLARDTSADGQFVYAVKSTGIYCRPSCPSRRPERRNVSFFATHDLAEAAGFRACLRCEPARTQPKADPQAAAIARAAQLLSNRAGEHTTLDELAAAAGLGRFALLRGFRRVLGITPAEFARERRKEHFRTTVRTPSLSITAALYESGFGSSSRLYEDVDATLGMSPTAMKAGGRGETIWYDIADSPLGRVLVATTHRGLCAVLFADTDASAAADLRERFPQAVLRGPEQRRPAVEGAPALGEAVRFVLSKLGESTSARMLPFDVRATAFQQRVWRALLDIPRGQTRSYAQIAQAVGSPKAVRAVGAACGANPLALVVPCHRVLASDGGAAGYRWGVERKQKLLALERALEAQPAEKNAGTVIEVS